MYRIVENLLVVLLLGLLALVLSNCSGKTVEAKDPLFYQAYKDVTFRNMAGDLESVKIPGGYRVCHCYSKIDSIDFECDDCELYY